MKTSSAPYYNLYYDRPFFLFNTNHLSKVFNQQSKNNCLYTEPFLFIAVIPSKQKVMFKKFLVLALLPTSVMVSCSDNSTNTSTETTDSTTAVMPADNMNSSSSQGVMVGGANMVPSKNIVENASASGDHTTLVAAVQAAGLVETLSGAGPFTVFAPTNEAFAKLPAGTVDNLLKPEMKNDLTGILTYHVVPGALKAADLTDGQKLTTVQGQELTVSVKDGKVTVNGANVTIADVISSNGITHVTDAVLTPSK